MKMIRRRPNLLKKIRNWQLLQKIKKSFTVICVPAAESGWDFSSRWFKNKNDFATIHTTDIIPVDLNCLLLNLEKTIAKAYQLSGNTDG